MKCLMDGQFSRLQRLEDDRPDFVQEIVLLYDTDTSCKRLVN